jgi:hypothetical protein
MPMPPNFRELGRSSALAARTSNVDSNGRAFLKFDVELAHFLRMLIEKYFLYWPTLEPSLRITMEKLQKFATCNRWSLPPAFNRWSLPPAFKRIFGLL